MWSLKATRIVCPQCKAEVKIETKYLQDKSRMICTSCDFEYPVEFLTKLQAAIKCTSEAYVYARDNLKGCEFDFIPFEK